ncbi:MAG: T9SS type A sorting domain-containing protein [candidate division WOR-3 bacterium]
MLNLIIITSLEDIYYKLLNLKDEIQTSNTCPSNETLDKLNSYLELMIKEIDENVMLKDTSFIENYIQSNIANLEKISNELENIKGLILSKCVPFLAFVISPNKQDKATCQCEKSTCSGIFCKCNSDGTCWAILKTKDNSRSFLAKPEVEKLSNSEVILYDLSGKVLFKGKTENLKTLKLKNGVYLIKTENGNFKKLIIY